MSPYFDIGLGTCSALPENQIPGHVNNNPFFKKAPVACALCFLNFPERYGLGMRIAPFEGRAFPGFSFTQHHKPGDFIMAGNAGSQPFYGPGKVLAEFLYGKIGFFSMNSGFSYGLIVNVRRVKFRRCCFC